jgi:hypothetical protein
LRFFKGGKISWAYFAFIKTNFLDMFNVDEGRRRRR